MSRYIELYKTAALTAKSERLRKLYTETAQLIEAQAKAFNDLYNRVQLCCQENDFTALREYVTKLEAAKKKLIVPAERPEGTC